MGKRKKPIQFNDKRLFYTIQEVADHFAVNVSLLLWSLHLSYAWLALALIAGKRPAAPASTPERISSRWRWCITS